MRLSDSIRGSSNREKDYNRASGRLKSLYYDLKRGHFVRHGIDRMKWHIAPRLFHVVDFPTHLDIEVSVSCQMRCPMCRRKQMPKDLRYGQMDFGLFKKIIDESSERGIYSVKLSWRGEPLLHPQIVAMVRYAKEKGIPDVAFLTNGERLTPELTKGLVEAGLDWISISVDGTGETYEKIRYPETYPGIVKKITFLKRYRDESGKNKPLIRIQTIYAAVKENPADYFAFWEPIADRVFVIADQSRSDVHPFPRNPHYLCYEPWRRMVIGWNGLVTNCICDYDELNLLGDVTRQSIAEIWHGEQFSRLRNLIRSRRLSESPVCSVCHDAGVMYTIELQIRGKPMRVGLYEGQELDLATMDARPGRTK